jgi:hypothetical protein
VYAYPKSLRKRKLFAPTSRYATLAQNYAAITSGPRLQCFYPKGTDSKTVANVPIMGIMLTP